ncbi:MAG: 2-hydroxycarboxylate transporter family protein [Treponema sp.]|nr:2-hydroxycarboxylate transporter family protein [Treponema sp.]
MSNDSAALGKSSGFQIYNMPLPVYAAVFAVVMIASYLNVIPAGMIGGFALTITIGAFFNEIGARLPIVKTYFGGGPIIVIFGSAALVYFGILNTRTVGIVDTIMRGGGLLDFVIAALITGSILGMNRKLLVKAVFGYIPAIIGGIIVSFGLVFIFGAISGYGGVNAMLMIAVPIMGGGMGAGAVPLSQIYAAQSGLTPESMLAIMVPAVALANALAIIAGALLDTIGKKYPKLSGNGQLMQGFSNENAQSKDDIKDDSLPLTVGNLGMGLLLSVAFYCLGTIIGRFIPGLHPYAWMIIMVAVVKVAGILPSRVEIACSQWFQFAIANWTIVILCGIGIVYTDLNDVIAAFSPTYLLLVFITVLGGILGAGLVGRLVRFYFVESAITAGLCMANMGGTGDVAVLSAAKRMPLMPFAQISSRIGGAIMLLLASMLARIFNLGG